MAQIQLRIVPDTGPTIQTSISIGDSDVQRILTAGAAAFPGSNNQQLLNRVLRQIAQRAIMFTKSSERKAATVNDITIT